MARTLSIPLRLLLLVALLIGLVAVVPPVAAEASTTAEQDFAQRLNRERTNRGLPALQVTTDLRSVARTHSGVMASRNLLHHNPSLSTDVKNWSRLSENVGRGSTSLSLHNALMNSTGHRRNILDPNVSQVGVGVVVRNGTMWVTQVFRQPTGTAVLATPVTSTFPGGFSDVSTTSTHGNDIERLRKAKVTSGCGSGRYCPSRSVSRAEMASFIVRAKGLPSVRGNRFRDVSGTHAADINALAAAGITQGCNPPRNDRFCPDRSVTRAEMATFMTRALKLPATSRAPFRDVSGTHAGDINRLANSGITRGCNPPTNNRFCPQDRVTREQMASFLVRGFGL